MGLYEAWNDQRRVRTDSELRRRDLAEGQWFIPSEDSTRSVEWGGRAGGARVGDEVEQHLAQGS